MIESYLTDTVDIVDETFDQDGVRTGTTTQSGVKARIEDENRVVRNQAGEEVASDCLVLIDPAAAVRYESKVLLKTQDGAATQEPAKPRAILWLGKGHGFGFEFWRVRL